MLKAQLSARGFLFEKSASSRKCPRLHRMAHLRSYSSLDSDSQNAPEVIGGITFREFRHRKFAETVFCAVSSEQQVKDFGAHLMVHLKDYVEATSPVMHPLTYADNYATGYFQKQGSAKEIILDKPIWMGYEGGTLMQYSLLPRIRYLEAGRMLLKQKETVQAKSPCPEQEPHRPPAAPAVDSPASHCKPHRHALHPRHPCDRLVSPHGRTPRVPRHGPHFNETRRFLYQIQSHRQACLFLNAVNKDEVPNYYYNVITSPMGLSTMEKGLEHDHYAIPKDYIADVMLIFSNCRQYNDATTVYAKCAAKLEKYMWSLVKEIPEWHDLVEE
ncbi:hypothetical protein VTI74DRAFT_9815 [Chaetomium olivicolor]